MNNKKRDNRATQIPFQASAPLKTSMRETLNTSGFSGDKDQVDPETVPKKVLYCSDWLLPDWIARASGAASHGI